MPNQPRRIILEKSKTVRRRYQRSNKRFQFTASQIRRIEREEERELRAKELREKEKKRQANKKKRAEKEAKEREERRRLGLPDPHALPVPSSQPLLFKFLKKLEAKPNTDSKTCEETRLDCHSPQSITTSIATENDESLHSGLDGTAFDNQIAAGVSEPDNYTASNEEAKPNTDSKTWEDTDLDCHSLGSITTSIVTSIATEIDESLLLGLDGTAFDDQIAAGVSEPGNHTASNDGKDKAGWTQGDDDEFSECSIFHDEDIIKEVEILATAQDSLAGSEN
ncbi:uncharacterized protein CDV56_100344 [Aspergillus thermomutatus]|uniref:Uncharacterized protein n=1 Tax=Aspergillus thermomutatus TaxID=41047 RepID=A0A397GIH7_ASPTH|nr:uncharacterized protein CDV56_100344 [Aspergillus thermomutatus]RHZ50297.1 hypothetical protein CDV56_100344 [Aspergillus thermomutatus]